MNRAVLVGFAASLLAHLIIALVAAFWSMQMAQAGGAGGSGQAVEFAVYTEAELSEILTSEMVVDSPAVPEVETDDAPAIELVDTSLGDTSIGLVQNLTLAAGDISASIGQGGGALGGGAANFFGVEARGTRFAYIVDVSGSMGVGGKLDALKRELSRSVESLLENTSFIVVPFSSGASTLNERADWTRSTENGKAVTRRAIASLVAQGGTDPLPGFELVYRLRPRPDAIYLMTDGEFDDSVVGAVAAMNADLRIPIHCIAFVSRDGEGQLRAIAEASGGTYAFVAGLPALPGGKP